MLKNMASKNTSFTLAFEGDSITFEQDDFDCLSTVVNTYRNGKLTSTRCLPKAEAQRVWATAKARGYRKPAPVGVVR